MKILKGLFALPHLDADSQSNADWQKKYVESSIDPVYIRGATLAHVAGLRPYSLGSRCRRSRPQGPAPIILRRYSFQAARADNSGPEKTITLFPAEPISEPLLCITHATLQCRPPFDISY